MMFRHFTAAFISFFLFLSLANISLANPIKETFEKAMIAFSEGRYQEAIDLYKKTIEMYPKFAPGYFYIGMSQKAKGSPMTEVVPYFRKAIEIDPNYAVAYENLGKLYYANADFVRALENVKKAVEIDDRLISAHLTLGWIYLLGHSRPREAIESFKNVLKYEEIAFAYFGLGMAYFMDEQKFMTLETITKLRGLGEDNLATKLEDMVRDGKYTPPKEKGIPLFGALTGAGAMPAPKVTFSEFIQNQPDAERPVQLLSPESEQPAFEGPSFEEMTGEERIRALQQRGIGN